MAVAGTITHYQLQSISPSAFDGKGAIYERSFSHPFVCYQSRGFVEPRSASYCGLSRFIPSLFSYHGYYFDYLALAIIYVFLSLVVIIPSIIMYLRKKEHTQKFERKDWLLIVLTPIIGLVIGFLIYRLLYH